MSNTALAPEPVAQPQAAEPLSKLFIVTRNHTADVGEQGHKYMMRPRYSKPSAYESIAEVILCNARFRSTGVEFPYEAGFGCGVVCVGELVDRVTRIDLGRLTALRFDGVGFATVPEGKLLPIHPSAETLPMVIFNRQGVFALV